MVSGRESDEWVGKAVRSLARYVGERIGLEGERAVKEDYIGGQKWVTG